MKIKLTLNIDDKIIEKAKKFISGKNISLSSVVENYLAQLSTENISQQNGVFKTDNNSTNKKTNQAYSNIKCGN